MLSEGMEESSVETSLQARATSLYSDLISNVCTEHYYTGDNLYLSTSSSQVSASVLAA